MIKCYIYNDKKITFIILKKEIEYYIRRHSISSYIILDDDESLFPYPERINLYLTNYKTGLTESDIKKLKKICNGR